MNKTSFIFERKENKNNKTVKWLDWMTISKDEDNVWRDSEKNDLESNEIILPSNVSYVEEEEEEEEEERKETVLRSALKTIKRDSRVSYNGTMESQFKPTSKRISHQTYDEKDRNKWINDSIIEEITYLDLLCFYFTSLYNNKQYKFQFVEYIGEITMMYEQIDKRIKDLIAKKERYKYSEVGNYEKLNFLFEQNTDVVTRSFYRMDLFLKSHLKFMRLCSAPVDLFLEKYYSARNNSCGLITHINLEKLIREKGCGKGNSIKEEKFFIEFDLCKDENSKELFFEEMTNKIYKNSNNQYDTTVRRCAALHNMLGELTAISEFIKTTVDMNDQLLFRVMVLAGNFFVLIGEYVWNTRLKHHFD